MQALLNRFPPIRSNSTEEIPDFPIGVDLPAFGGIDLGKGNTTSVTKVGTNNCEHNNQQHFYSEIHWLKKI